MKNSFRIIFLRSLTILPMAAFCLHGQAYADDTAAKNTSKYEGQSLCDAGDEIYLSCPTRAGKIISSCGTTKQKPGLMYLVYGTPEKIDVSSPRTGEFPLKRSQISMAGAAWYFSENGKYYIQYAILGLSSSFAREGFIILNSYNHKVMAHDLCKTHFKVSSRVDNSNKYIDRQYKSPSHNDDIDGKYDFDLDDFITDTVK